MPKAKFLFYIASIFFSALYGFTQTPKRDTSTSTLDSLYTLVNETKNKQEKVQSILALCNYYEEFTTRNLDSLYHYANKALNLTKGPSNLEGQNVDALYYLAFHAIKTEEITKANSYITQIKSISERQSYPIGLIHAEKLSASISYHENNVNMAILHVERAYQIAINYKLPKHVVFTNAIDLAGIYLNNRYNKEIVSNLLFENIDLADGHDTPLKDKAVFYFYLGFYYDIYDIDIDKTIENYNKSIALYTKINDNIGLSYPLINLAEAYQKLDNHNKAIETFNSALDLALTIKQKDDDAYSIIYYGLGLSYLELKDYNASEYNFRKSIKKNKLINDYSGEADCLKKIGEIYLKKGNVKKGNTTLNFAAEGFKKGVLELRKQNSLDKEISYAYEQISEIYELTNNYKKSLEYHTLYTAFNDSINNAQNIKVTERFKFLEEATEKNKEIEILKNLNKIQEIKAEKERTFKIGLILFLVLIALLLFILFNRYRLKQKALRIIKQKNEENKLLMREIHHRVKNNLQIISSLLGVQINNHFNNDELKTILQESQNKIKSMAIIHKNLYKGDRFAKVSVTKYVDDLIAEIKSGFTDKNNEIKFDLDIVEKEIQIGLAVPLGLILNELITNSCKYAFYEDDSKEKKITIKFHYLKDSAQYNLVVQDNGKGLHTNFDIEKVNSFGIQLVNSLVAQLNGKIKVSQKQGTQFEILLKEPGTI